MPQNRKPLNKENAMAKWGNCDYKQLQQLRENIAHLQGIDMDKFCKDMSK